MSLEIYSNLVALRKSLDELMTSDEYILVDWPDYNNTGDHFIWLGAKYLLNQMGKVCLRDFSAWEARTQPMPGLDPNVTVICSGGGNFGDLYGDFQLTRERLLNIYPHNRVIVLPQTIKFSDENKLLSSANIFRQHGNAFVFGRDRESADVSSLFSGDGKPRLATDCANSLGSIIAFISDQLRGYKPPYKIGLVARTDEESAQKTIQEDIDIIFDWVYDATEYDELVNGYHGEDSSRIIDSVMKLFGRTSELDLISINRAILGIKLINTCKFVITDRLHVHIVLSMLSRPHIIMDNNYGKNGRYYDAWSRNAGVAELV